MNNDKNKTREELIAELKNLRQELTRLEVSTGQATSSTEQPCLDVMENMLEGCQIIGPDWRYLYVNDSVVRHGRQPKETLLGHKIMEVYPGIENTDLFTFMQRCMQERIPHKMENEFTFPEGDKGWFDLHIQPVPQGIFILSIDITERRKFGDALRENEEKLRLFFENTPVAIAMFDRGMHYLVASQSWKKNYNLENKEIVGHSHYEFFPDLPERWKKAHHQGLSGEVVKSEEDKFINDDGTVQWGRWEIHPWHKANKDIGGIIIFVEDITPQKLAFEKVQESEAKFRTIVEQTPAVTYFAALDENSTTTYISPQIEEMLGFTAEEYQENPDTWIEQLHPEDREHVLEEVKRSHQKGERLSTEYRMFTKDGRVVWCSDVADMVKNEAGEPMFLQGLMTDITDRKQTEENINKYINRIESLLEIGRAVSTTLDLNEILDIIMLELGKYCPYSSISVQLFNGKFLEVIACRGFEQPDEVIGLKYPLDSGYPNYKVIESKEPLAVENITLEFPVFQTESSKYKSENIQSWLGVPMISKDTVTGMIALDRSTVDVFSEEEIQMASAIAGQAALAINNAQLFDEIEKNTNRIESLLEVGKAVSSTLDLDKILDIMMLELRKYCPYDSVSVQLFHGQYLEIIACQGFKRPENVIGIRLPMDIGIPNYKIIKSKGPLAVDDMWLEYPIAKNETSKYDVDEVHSWLGVPLISKDNVVGMFTLDRSTVDPFSEEEIRMASAIAGHAALAIKNAQLYNEADQRLNKLKALQLIDHAITSSFDIKVMLNVLLEQVITHLQVDAADILIFDPYQSNLVYAAGSGFITSSIKSSRLRIGESYSGRAALERRPFHIPDVTAASPPLVRYTMITDENFVSFYTQPLISKGEIRGVLEIFHRSRLNVTAEWIDDLKTFGGQAAIAIENTKLFDNLMRTNMDLTLAYDATIEGWSRIVEVRTGEVEGHTQRVTDLTVQLAQKMGMSEKDLQQVRRGAMLHDFGKLSIPDAILFKKGKLTDEDWQVVKQYPEFAFNMLSKINYLHDALDIPYCHHENWDGTGYPRGLKGEDIPLAARIFAVANAWDSLLSGRHYREPWDEERTLAFILEKSGKYFDPQVVQTFMLMLGKSNPEDRQSPA